LSGAEQLPEGFVAARRGRTTLIEAARCAGEFAGAGLGSPEGWEQRLLGPAGAAGRGATARVELAGGSVARIKRLRRGGLGASVWRGRFWGARRLLDNLRLPIVAAERGVATAAPLALLLQSDRLGWVRAWLAVGEIEGATDLRSRIAAGRPIGDELDATMRLVRRMHDRGVEHRDLNLGNLLVRGPAGAVEAFVVDLDRGRLHAGPLGFRARRRGLRRMERSYVKACHPGRAADDLRTRIYSSYAAGDLPLARRLERGRGLGRIWIALHRLGWGR